MSSSKNFKFTKKRVAESVRCPTDVVKETLFFSDKSVVVTGNGDSGYGDKDDFYSDDVDEIKPMLPVLSKTVCGFFEMPFLLPIHLE